MPLKDLLFGFKGRIRRRDWWIWNIAGMVAWILVYAAFLFMLDSSGTFEEAGAAVDAPVTVIAIVSFLPLLWVQAALAAKRAHDRARGALVPVGVMVLGAVLSFVADLAYPLFGAAVTAGQFDAFTLAIDVVTGAISLYLLIVLGILEGTPGPNRFGRSPKGIGGEPADETAGVFS